MQNYRTLTENAYLKEADEKQHIIIQACSSNMGYFLFAFLALMGLSQL